MDKKELNILMDKIQNGDELAFTLFYNNTHKGVFSFIYSYVKNWHIAEELLQETYIKVKLNVNKYKIGSNPMAWVLQIAKNNCLDYLRKENLHKEQYLNEELTEDMIDSSQSLYVHDLINKHIDSTSRQIVILHLIYGYKNREIANILGIPLGTVLWKYNKAIKLLKNIIKEDYV